MLSAIRKAGVYSMAGHTLRFNTVVNAVRREVGRIGRIDSIVLTQRFGPQTQIEWIDDPARAGGGNILHTGVHSFDLIRYMTGLETATAACRTSSVYTESTEDNFAALLTFRDSHATGLVNCARSSPARNGLIEISGENGQLVGDHVLNTLMWITPDGVEPVELDAPKQTVQEALNALVEDARTGAAPRADFHDGLVAVAVVDACYRAAQSGRHETVVLPLDPAVV
jgi:predicted dehydrogenase